MLAFFRTRCSKNQTYQLIIITMRANVVYMMVPTIVQAKRNEYYAT